MKWTWGLVALTLACQPRPLDVIEERAEFPRSALRNDRLLVDKLPDDAERFSVTFEDQIELIGGKVSPPNPKPGQEIAITAYYKVLKPLSESWKLFVHLDGVGSPTGCTATIAPATVVTRRATGNPKRS